jgi:dipeptidyl aminopeptidase/acylaminoacyl peptidase
LDTPLIPRELLFGNPDRIAPELSPDGGRLAYIAPDEGVLNVWVRTVGATDDRPVTKDRDRGIRDFTWAEDGEHLLYVQDRQGDENWHLYRVPAAGGDAVDLTPLDGVQTRIVAVERDLPHEILIGLNDRDPQFHDVWRVDLRTGERTLEVENTIGAVDWIADHRLVVRVGQVPTADGGFVVLCRASADAEWEELFVVDPEDALSSSILGFSRDGRRLYFASSAGTNAAELRVRDLETGETEVLAGDPTADIQDVLFDPETREPQAAVFWKERKVWRILDPSMQADYERLSAVSDGDLHIVNRDRSGAHWLAAYTRDTGPVHYHAYDRASGETDFLFSARPALDGQPLATMKPISYRSRDGLTIHGYLTLPPGREPNGLPAVLNIHGGPWHRDFWGLNPEAQWLANRGYACLQINFRGSTGYGKEFLNAGDREWGGKMQDDVTDGARWLVDEGVADPARIGIYGGSYGGFATLSALTKTPEVFACGVSIVGPSNLITFSRSIPPYWEPLRALFEKRVGDVETEEEFLRSRSPLFRIDRIRAPLLIVQGKNDPRVKREESLQIVEALRQAGKTVDYLEFEDEGHGFAKPENRLAHYARAEKFLAEHLGGRRES